MDKQSSPWTRCIFPLLDALGWKGDRRALAEFYGSAEELRDLMGFRNFLAALRFDSKTERIKSAALDPRLLPCLYVAPGDAPFCIIRRDEAGFFVYDGIDGRFRTIKALPGKGTAVVFQPLEAEADSIFSSRSDWLGILIGRFKSKIIAAFGFSFVLGLISLLYPLLIAALYSQMTIRGNQGSVRSLGIGVMVFILSETGFRYMRSALLGYTSLRSGKVLGEELVRRLLAFQASFTESASTEAQIRRLKDLRTIADFVSGQALSAIFDLPFVLFMLAWMMGVGGFVALVPAFFIMVFLILSFFFYPIIKRLQASAAAARARRMDIAAAVIAGSEDIVLCGMEPVWRKKFEDASGKAILADYKDASAQAIVNASSSFFVSAGGLATLYFGVQAVLAGTLPASALVASMMLVWRVLGIVRSTFVVLNQVESLRNSLGQLRRFMVLAQEARPIAFTVPQRIPEGSLYFRDISFRYTAEGYPALYSVNFSAESGRLTVLAGHQGAGKTTLLKLALSLYKPQAGRVLLGPFNIQQLDPTALRRSVAYASESPYMFKGTFMDFIKNYSQEDDDLELIGETADSIGLTAALRETGLDLYSPWNDADALAVPDIPRLTMIVRTLVRRTSLYLFDEQPFKDNGRFMPAYIAALARCADKGIPVLAVANDPGLIAQADRIVRLDAGRVIEIKDRK